MSDLYERGFSAGERAAWRERKSGVREQLRRQHIPEWDQGWLDGYTPRSSEWVNGRTVPESMPLYPLREAA